MQRRLHKSGPTAPMSPSLSNRLSNVQDEKHDNEHKKNTMTMYDSFLFMIDHKLTKLVNIHQHNCNITIMLMVDKK